MSAMTMSFPVKDEAMLVKLQPLQKVEFELSYDGKDYVITRIK
jgi:Cu/Ag efflux protein CusF